LSVVLTGKMPVLRYQSNIDSPYAVVDLLVTDLQSVTGYLANL